MYLIDTSVWIDLLKGTENHHVQFLENLLDNGDAHLCEVTYAEICFGAKNESQFNKYTSYFSALPFLFLPHQWHEKVAQMGFELKRKGLKPFLGDLLIACIALHNQVPLLTRDNDFKAYQQIFGLKIE